MYVCMYVCMYAMYVWWHTPALEEDRAADSVGSWANRGGEGNNRDHGPLMDVHRGFPACP